MKIKRMISCFCAALMLLMPLKAFAVETEVTGQEAEAQAPEIQFLTPEEAEELYHQIFGNEGISLHSDLGTCDVGISSQDGKLLVVYSTACRGIASKIGVRNFTLQQKNGLFWKDIVIRSDYSENTDAFFGGFTMSNPEDGKKYRAHCVHYAIKNGEELSLYTETEAYTFRK